MCKKRQNQANNGHEQEGRREAGGLRWEVDEPRVKTDPSTPDFMRPKESDWRDAAIILSAFLMSPCALLANPASFVLGLQPLLHSHPAHSSAAAAAAAICCRPYPFQVHPLPKSTVGHTRTAYPFRRLFHPNRVVKSPK